VPRKNAIRYVIKILGEDNKKTEYLAGWMDDDRGPRFVNRSLTAMLFPSSKDAEVQYEDLLGFLPNGKTAEVVPIRYR
jgi:hypothetical protein